MNNSHCKFSRDAHSRPDLVCVCVYLEGGRGGGRGGVVVVVGTVVNRSVCLFGSVLCMLVYFQFTSHLHVPPSLSLILNKDRKFGHEGILEFQRSQVPLFTVRVQLLTLLHIIRWWGGTEAQ